MIAILLQPFGETAEPLSVDERLENPAHLELVRLASKRPQEAKLDHALDMAVDAVMKARLIGGIGEEQLEHVGDHRAREDEPAVAAGCVELDQLLAQQRQQQADPVLDRKSVV